MPTINTHGDGSEAVARCCDLYPDCLHVVQSGEQEAEARRLTIEHDLEWLRRVERRMEGVPVTENFGTLYFTCAAKLETRLRQLAEAEQELAVYKEREARYKRDRAELDRIDREAGDV